MKSIKTADISNDDFIYSIKNLIESIIKQKVNTILPGEVVTVEKNEASVRSLVMERQSTYPPVIHHNVPIVMPSGGDFTIKHPIKPGDQGLLFTCKKDISLFKRERKGAKTQTDRTFDINDNVFMPLLFTKEPLDQKEAVITYLDNKVTMKEKELIIEAADKVTIKTGAVTITLLDNQVRVQTEGEVDVTTSEVKLNCNSLSCPPLKENMKAILELLDALASGMIGSGTNATNYRAQRPLKEAVFDLIK